MKTLAFNTGNPWEAAEHGVKERVMRISINTFCILIAAFFGLLLASG